MKQYIALIRGINVGGKNKVSMADLKTALEKLGHEEVSTYINSGNVIFKSNTSKLETLVAEFEKLLDVEFNVQTRVAVIGVDEYHEAAKYIPEWWDAEDGNPTDKHNAVFIIAPATAESVAEVVGEPKLEYEKIALQKHVIFWSAPLKTFGRTRWSKIVSTPAYNDVTIRNANTFRKLLELTRQGE